jgi:hypothetical protein
MLIARRSDGAYGSTVLFYGVTKPHGDFLGPLLGAGRAAQSAGCGEIDPGLGASRVRVHGREQEATMTTLPFGATKPARSRWFPLAILETQTPDIRETVRRNFGRSVKWEISLLSSLSSLMRASRFQPSRLKGHGCSTQLKRHSRKALVHNRRFLLKIRRIHSKYEAKRERYIKAYEALAMASDPEDAEEMEVYEAKKR